MSRWGKECSSNKDPKINLTDWIWESIGVLLEISVPWVILVNKVNKIHLLLISLKRTAYHQAHLFQPSSQSGRTSHLYSKATISPARPYSHSLHAFTTSQFAFCLFLEYLQNASLMDLIFCGNGGLNGGCCCTQIMNKAVVLFTVV